MENETFLSDNFKYKIDPINFKIKKKYNLNINISQQSEELQSEWQQSEGRQSEGQQSEGRQSEGQQSEGWQSEGQQSESSNIFNRFKFTFNDMLSDFDNRESKNKRCNVK